MRARSCHQLAMVGLAMVVGGCSSVPSAEETLERGPLPYEVGVFVDEEALQLPPGALPESVVRYLDDGDALLEHLQDAISVEQAVVSRVVRLSATRRAEAVRESAGLDLLLAVGFETPEEFPPNGLSGAWMSLEVVSWLFGGIPSWFVPSMLYRTGVEMRVEGLDLHQPRVDRWLASHDEGAPDFDWRQEYQVDDRNISLTDRAAIRDRPGDYALTILVPPSVVKPGNPARLSRSLTDSINAELGSALAEGLRAQLLDEVAMGPLGVAFVSPDPNRVHEDPELELTLAIASSDGVPISRLMVSRQVSGADPYLWEADAPELEALAQRLAEFGGTAAFAPFPVSARLPLEPGENVVKVRLSRTDGIGTVRTMVFFH